MNTILIPLRREGLLREKRIKGIATMRILLLLQVILRTVSQKKKKIRCFPFHEYDTQFLFIKNVRRHLYLTINFFFWLIKLLKYL